MAFGRSPHDPFSSSGFGPTPPSGSPLDAPYADGAADGFGDRGPAASGFGRPPAPFAAGPAPFGPEPFGPANDPDRPVTHAQLAESTERAAKLNALRLMMATKFKAMNFALSETARSLAGPKRRQSSLLGDMINLAASAAIAGAAGVVAEILAKRLSKEVMPEFDRFKQAHQRFANDAIKEHLKKSFHVGVAVQFEDSETVLGAAFAKSQFSKMNEAERHFHAAFDDQMAGVSNDELRAAVAREDAGEQDLEIINATQMQIAVEWANLLARVHHGAGDWDPWAGPHGSADAMPMRDAAPPKGFPAPGAPVVESEHPSSGNVDHDSESIREATDDDQRTMNSSLHGILEINLWGAGLVKDGDGAPGQYRHTRFQLYNRSGHGMRLAGVSGHVKGLISKFSQVRDLKMNKVIAIHDNEDLNPSKPVGRFLITADGYVRRTTTEGGEAEMQDAADFAQSLSPGLLQ